MKRLIYFFVLLLVSATLFVGCAPEEPVPEEPPVTEETPPVEEHVHSFGMWKTTKATCLRPGKRVRACACGESESEVLPALGHNIGAWTVDNEPDCLNGGDRYRKCKTCNVELEREELPALGHDFVATKVHPDYQLEGYTKHVCSRCADSYDDEFIPSWGQVQFLYAVNPEDKTTCTIMDVILNETTELHIPETVIDKNQEYRVTAIGAHAFEDCKELTVIRIPDGVTSIGDHAFASCVSLAEIYIPDGVTSIGASAFEGCLKLPEITIPETVSSIGAAAFRDCKLLAEISLPEAVNELSDYLFAGCQRLVDVEFAAISRIGDGAFLDCSFIAELPKLDSVVEIGDNAFASCINLASVSFGESLIHIGNCAFFNTPALELVEAPNLDFWYDLEILGGDANPLNGKAKLCIDGEVVTDVVIPEGSTSISPYLFFGYDHLVSVVVPASVTSVGESAFARCASLESADMLADIERMPESLFADCAALVRVTLPEKLTHVGLAAFAGCSSLSEIILPESVYYISAGAFENCVSLSEIVIPDGVSVIFAETFRNCSSLKSVRFPTALVRIEYAAFEGCSTLEALDLPEGLVSINSAAFVDCSGILEITIPSTLKSIGYSAFDGCTVTRKIRVDSLDTWCAIDFANVEANPLSVSKNEYDEDGFLTKPAAKLYVGDIVINDLVITSDMTDISDYAFWLCEGFDSLCFRGTASELAALDVAYNPFFIEMKEEGKLYFYSQSEPTEAGRFWYYNAYGFVCKW